MDPQHWNTSGAVDQRGWPARLVHVHVPCAEINVSPSTPAAEELDLCQIKVASLCIGITMSGKHYMPGGGRTTPGEHNSRGRTTPGEHYICRGEHYARGITTRGGTLDIYAG